MNNHYKLKKVSIGCVMPAFNEQQVIEETIERTFQFWNSQDNYNFFLTIVDDGSRDNTPSILEKLEKKYKNLYIIIKPNNQGKGAAIREGVLSAQPENLDVVYCVDSDLPFSFEDQKKVAESVINNKGTKVSYGSRFIQRGGLPGAGEVQGESLVRKFASFGLGLLNRFILGIKIKDTQCGLKAFQPKIAHEIFSINTINGFGFDLFTASYLAKKKIAIDIIPVKLLPATRASSVNVFSTSAKMLIDIVKVKILTTRI